MGCEGDYIVGQRVRFSFEIRDAGVLADPATLTFAFAKPDGSGDSYVYGTDAEWIRTAGGKYYVELTFDQAGWWTWRQESTGVVTATQGKLRVGAALL